MTETSQLKKYLIWYKVKELFSTGLNKTQIGQSLRLHRQTVAKYLSITEEEFMLSPSYDRHDGHKLATYEPDVVSELRKWPFLSVPQLHDRLKEHFADLPSVTSKTVFNFVNRVCLIHNLPKEIEKSYRLYEKQPETSYGQYAQCDFGEQWMRTPQGQSLKVYFLTMSLSRSRYKFVYFSRTPFTTALAVYAHELAFEFFHGIPRKIMYDQDKMFLVRDYKAEKISVIPMIPRLGNLGMTDKEDLNVNRTKELNDSGCVILKFSSFSSALMIASTFCKNSFLSAFSPLPVKRCCSK